MRALLSRLLRRREQPPDPRRLLADARRYRDRLARYDHAPNHDRTTFDPPPVSTGGP